MNSLFEQIRVLRALIVRDLMMRYGRDGGGFAWVVVEPMLLCVGVTAIWMLIKPGFEKGILVAALVFTGYMPLTLWRHITGFGVGLFRSNKNLFYHDSISTLDLFWSRIILEFVGTSTSFIVVYIILMNLGFVEPIYDWSLCLLSWITMAYMAISTSLLFSVATELYEWSERLIHPFQYLLIPLSGTFFVAEWLPETARQIIWYNPLIHVYEMMRAGFIGPSLMTYSTWWYPIIFSTVTLCFGCVAVKNVRKQVHV